jgi:hypothetical protein
VPSHNLGPSSAPQFRSYTPTPPVQNPYFIHPSRPSTLDHTQISFQNRLNHTIQTPPAHTSPNSYIVLSSQQPYLEPSTPPQNQQDEYCPTPPLSEQLGYGPNQPYLDSSTPQNQQFVQFNLPLHQVNNLGTVPINPTYLDSLTLQSRQHDDRPIQPTPQQPGYSPDPSTSPPSHQHTQAFHSGLPPTYPLY